MDDTLNTTKINRLMSNWPKGTVKTVKELGRLGYSPQLLKIYSKSKWIQLFVRGMYKRYDDEVNWEGVLYGIQQKGNISIHAGGKTALEMKGFGHYLRARENKVYLFSDRKETRQVWLNKLKDVILKRNEIFDYGEEGYFTNYHLSNFSIKISAPELAAMEMLYLVPKEQSFDEAIKLVEGLTTLRVNLVQRLLEGCNSIKVKRLFLFMTESLDLPWFQQLDFEKLNLGIGKRLVVRDGVLDKKYGITVPKEYAR
jgi:hypothetical protein